MKLSMVAVAASIALLSGCAINQTVKPIDRFAGKLVCVVDNPKVRSTFADSYKQALRNKGYEVRQLDKDASLIECPITSTYVANWKWDLAMYMSFADITVYNNGKPAGRATYDSTRGGANMGKFIGADKKVTELVDQLFPTLAGT